jgi:hypothetical protein
MNGDKWEGVFFYFFNYIQFCTMFGSKLDVDGSNKTDNYLNSRRAMRQRIDNESAVQLALSTCCVVTAVTIYE